MMNGSCSAVCQEFAALVEENDIIVGSGDTFLEDAWRCFLYLCGTVRQKSSLLVHCRCYMCRAPTRFRLEDEISRLATAWKRVRFLSSFMMDAALTQILCETARRAVLLRGN
jgi:hypothetical protein